MKRRYRRRRYHRRRRSLSASNWGPVVALLGTVIGIAAVIALIVFVGFPKLLPIIGVDYRGPFAESPTPEPTLAPTPTPNPMDSFVAADARTEVVFDEAGDYKWFGDPYFYNGKMIFSAGKLVDGKALLGDLYMYEPATRTAEKLNITLTNVHFLFPKFNDDWLIYLDAKYDGGGLLMALDRTDASAKPVVIKEIYTGQPEPMLDGDSVAWIERTGTRMDKLFVCDLNTLETVVVHMFSNNSYGESLPCLNGGKLVWADAKSSGSTDSDDVSVIYTASLSNGALESYTPGGYVHDPESCGKYTAWLDSPHSPDTGLWLSVSGGEAKLIASGIVQFGIGNSFIGYAKDEVIYVYRFDNGKTYQISAEYEAAQFMGVSDGRVIWMDVTSRERDILKFAEIPR